MKIFATILSVLGILPSKKKYEQWAETCGFFTTFIETRYPGHPVPVPPGDEKTFYDACCFCGMLDSDGVASLLGQPASVRQAMEHSLEQLGLTNLIELAGRASDALSQAGLSLERRRDEPAISTLMEPFEEEYYDKLRDPAYARLHKFMSSSRAFVSYARNCARIDRTGGNPFDPKEWTPEKMAAL